MKMQKFSLSLICVGFEDNFIGSLDTKDITIYRKGDIWRKRTGQKYKENIAKLSLAVVENEGYGVVLDRLSAKVDSDDALSALLSNCREVEVQFSASLDDKIQMPHLHLSVKQLEFLLKISAEIDIHIS